MNLCIKLYHFSYSYIKQYLYKQLEKEYDPNRVLHCLLNEANYFSFFRTAFLIDRAFKVLGNSLWQFLILPDKVIQCCIPGKSSDFQRLSLVFAAQPDSESFIFLPKPLYKVLQFC